MSSLMFFQVDPRAEFFLEIAHALHDKVKKLIYRSPVTGDVVILDHKGSGQLSAVSGQLKEEEYIESRGDYVDDYSDS